MFRKLWEKINITKLEELKFGQIWKKCLDKYEKIFGQIWEKYLDNYLEKFGNLSKHFCMKFGGKC